MDGYPIWCPDLPVVHSANYRMVLLIYFNIAYCNSTAWQQE